MKNKPNSQIFARWRHCMVPIVPIQHTVTEIQNGCHFEMNQPPNLAVVDNPVIEYFLHNPIQTDR